MLMKKLKKKKAKGCIVWIKMISLKMITGHTSDANKTGLYSYTVVLPEISLGEGSTNITLQKM